MRPTTAPHARGVDLVESHATIHARRRELPLCARLESASGRFRAGFFFALGAATTEREEDTRFISPLNCANSASRRALSSLLPMRTQFLCETPNRVLPDSRQGAL